MTIEKQPDWIKLAEACFYLAEFLQSLSDDPKPIETPIEKEFETLTSYSDEELTSMLSKASKQHTTPVVRKLLNGRKVASLDDQERNELVAKLEAL